MTYYTWVTSKSLHKVHHVCMLQLMKVLLESSVVCELLKVSLPTKEDSLRERCQFSPMSALRIRDNTKCGCILVTMRHRLDIQTPSANATHTFAWVVLRRDNVLIPDYLLCWIKGHLVKLLNLRDSALMTWYLFVCGNKKNKKERDRSKKNESWVTNKCSLAY